MSGLGLQQSLSQRQTQVLAPQMRQGLDVLQAPSFALRALIRQEAERNPLLDVAEPESPSIDAMREAPEAPSDDGGGEGGSPDSSDGSREPELGDFSSLGADGADDLYANSGEGEFDPDSDARRQFMFDSIPAAESLQEHLLRQIEESDLPPRLRALAEQISGSLDEGGYLRIPLEEVAQSVFAPMDDARAALAAVQGFTPAGVGARDLRECLLLQLRAGEGGGPESPAARFCADAGAFEALASRRFDRAAEIAGTTRQEAVAALAQIARLDPFPGRRYDSSRVTFVKPEILVSKDPESGKWVATLDESDVPRVSIANRWRRRHRALKRAPGGAPESPAAKEARKEERRWLDSMLRSGDMLLYNIEQRQATILAVAQAVVEAQTEFFERGRDALRPLSMAAVAEKIGVNESTVSRAVAGKWMRSPRGLHELRSFFVSGVKTDSGESASVDAVKDRLRAMVAAEDPAAPLSDQAIMERFAAAGVKLARRTVAKYREALKIPSSQLRKK